MKNTVIWICRLAVGLLFIFSGLIKINDPLGFSYKLTEYFEVFHLTFLNGLALSLSIILCSLEIILGFALLIGVRAKQVAWGLLLLIIFFTFLTFYSAAFKVVQTCGCFGDAIPLTPWQSFSKDLILLLLIIVLFKNRGSIKPIFTNKAGDKALWMATIVSVGFGLYTYNYMPVVDFLPYKVGINLIEEMRVPPGAKPDEYQLTYQLKNKKSAETKELSDKEYLSTGIWKDSNWEIVGEPQSKLVKKGFTPKIVDLRIQDAQGTDYTPEILTIPFYSLVIVAYDLSKTDTRAINDLNAVCINLTREYNTRTILLTSAGRAEAEAFKKKNHLISEIFYADAVPLKSMVRANPGILLLKGGTVINKWNYNTIPVYNDLRLRYFLQLQ